MELVRRRLAERGRRQIIADSREAHAEFAAGKTRATPIDDLMGEIEAVIRQKATSGEIALPLEIGGADDSGGSDDEA